MIRRFLGAALAAIAISAAAQSTPATNYTDLWWNPAESGWGVGITQHPGTHQVFAVWYTYDPRKDAGSRNKPLWIVMPGGSWTSPTTLTGPVYVTGGIAFNQPGSNLRTSPVGSFTFNFADAGSGRFSYDISPPGDLAPSDPAYNLPAMSGTKTIIRQSF